MHSLVLNHTFCRSSTGPLAFISSQDLFSPSDKIEEVGKFSQPCYEAEGLCSFITVYYVMSQTEILFCYRSQALP